LAEPISFSRNEYLVNSLTGDGRLIGTLAYMAPEQLERGEATTASDIYALGLVMYEMVLGQRPFADRTPFAEAVKRIKQAAPSPKLVSAELGVNWDKAICKCLRRDPEGRFESVLQVAEVLTTGKEKAPTAEIGFARDAKGAWDKLTRIVNLRTHIPRKRAIGFALAFLAMSLFAAIFHLYQLNKDQKLAAGSMVLLTEVQNRTGESRFDATTELIRHQVSQSPYFNLMDRSRIQDVLGQMKKPRDTALDPFNRTKVHAEDDGRVLYS
jgi:serine/threonine protein kinase